MNTKNEYEDREDLQIKSRFPVKREFGFVVEQRVNKWTSRAEIEKSINNFFDVLGDILAEKYHIKKTAIETTIHYYGRKKILEDQFFVRKLINENVIDSLYYQGKAN